MQQKLQIGESGHLSDLIIGQKAKVMALHNENKALRRRLLDMGITKDVVISVKKIAPMGDPVDIELRGYELCLRLSDMQNIDVEVIE
ncbi:MAG: ferrous iron transport protein A [Clostridia bacterium]|nr:ferrous iron transport protein A [Clostridia bacterium]